MCGQREAVVCVCVVFGSLDWWALLGEEFTDLGWKNWEGVGQRCVIGRRLCGIGGGVVIGPFDNEVDCAL